MAIADLKKRPRRCPPSGTTQKQQIEDGNLITSGIRNLMGGDCPEKKAAQGRAQGHSPPRLHMISYPLSSNILFSGVSASQCLASVI